jgi:hypothetical protein
MEPQRSFWVKANWDSEADIFVSESNIIGLHIEARTLDEFQEIMIDLVPELIAANHGDVRGSLVPEEVAPVWNYECGQQLLQASS